MLIRGIINEIEEELIFQFINFDEENKKWMISKKKEILLK